MQTRSSNIQEIKGNDWPWSIYKDGNDLWIFDCRATCFGGGNDPQDNGETASGISTRLHPDILGCALPLAYLGANRALRAALGGSPIPRIPWHSAVEFHAKTGRIVRMQLIDLGPAKRTGNAIDLTLAAARLIDPKATARTFEARGDVRMIECAKYLDESLRAVSESIERERAAKVGEDNL